MSLSLLIPVYNERNQIEFTIKKIIGFSKKLNNIEIIFINDFCNDGTDHIIKKYTKKYKKIRLINNVKKGLGSAINLGIKKSKKDYVCIFMADLSDDFNDLKKYYKTISKKNLDAVMGTRFSKDSRVSNYPFIKFLLNRIFNNMVRLIFFTKYNDFTNAFKIYKRKTLLKCLPIVSENFNVFLEIPLKIIARRYNYKIISINWKNRSKGSSKFKIKELSSMYIFTLCYCLLEKFLLKKNLNKS